VDTETATEEELIAAAAALAAINVDMPVSAPAGAEVVDVSGGGVCRLGLGLAAL